MIKTAQEIAENKKLLLIQKYYHLDPDVLELIEGIILMDEDYFEKPITSESVAQTCRKCIISIVEDLMKNIPQSDFNNFDDKYEEGIEEKYENI